MEKKQTFEESLKQLETLVKELEAGNLTLAESVEKYNESLALARFCHQELEKAEKLVVKMMSEDGIVDFKNQDE